VVCNERSFSSRVRRRSSACAWYSRSAARFSRTLRSRTLEYSPSICRSRSGLSLNDSATSINWSASNCGICDGSSLLVNLRKFIKPSKSIFNNSAAHATNTHRSIQSVSQSVSQSAFRSTVDPNRSIDRSSRCNVIPSKTLNIARATAYRKSKSRLKNESQIRSAKPNGKLYMNPVMKNCGTNIALLMLLASCSPIHAKVSLASHAQQLLHIIHTIKLLSRGRYSAINTSMTYMIWLINGISGSQRPPML
jgi:hypothetical protein